MNDHDALLHAIGEHPEEDTPRLMYADWLEENGDPERADFVRNQVALGRPDLAGAELYAVVRKNRHYLTNFVRQWKAELPRIEGVEWGDFNRGLIEEARADGERPIVDRAAKIFGVPGVHVLRLWRLNDGQRLARVPELIRLRTFRLITTGTSATVLRALFASPHLTRLTAIDIQGSRANNDVVLDLVGGRFPDLTKLFLASNEIGDAGALALANSSHLEKVRVLDLWNNPIDDPAARAALHKRFGSALKM